MSPEPKRRVLGKGLGSLIPDSPTLDDRSTEVSANQSPRVAAGVPVDVPVDQIRPNPHQPRQQFRDEELDGLSASIKEIGILQPLVARRDADGKYTLIAGERRLRAARKAGLAKVPVVVRESGDDRLLIEALIENIQRDDLGAIETAQGFRDLVRSHGVTQAEVAERVGKPRSTVANYLRLLDLPEEVQALLTAGTLEFGHARALAGMEDAESQLKLARIAAEKKLTVREVETRARLMMLGGAGDDQPEERRDPNVVAAEKTLSRSLEAKVHIEINARGRGKVEIRFADEQDLERLYRQLLRATAKTSNQ